MYIPDRVLKQWELMKYRFLVSLAMILGVLFTFNTLSAPRYHPPSLPKEPAHIPFKMLPTWDPDYSQSAVSKRGMVVSDSEICSKLGLQILKMGGNAADAAVTTCLCIGTVDTMFSSGIGGGAFITSKKSNEDFAISIDSREMAPSSASRDMYKNKPLASKLGGLAVAIPGELMGLWKLYELHGSGNVTWENLVIPVSDLAKNGWHMDKRLEYGFDLMEDVLEYFKKDWAFAFNQHGKLHREGDLVQREMYGKTLESIAKNGVEAFYNPKGSIAQSLAQKAQEWGGILTAEDFAEYKVVVEDAIRVDNFTNNNYTIFTSTGSSSGLALASALKIIDKFDNTLEINDFGVQETHRLIESMKWLSSVRSHLGDINVYNQNKTAIEEHKQRYDYFLNDTFTDKAFSKIKSNETLDWREYEPAFEPNDPHGTSSLSIVDQWGNSVTLTTTINLLFGSCVHDPDTGVILNNEMDDFSQPGTSNAFGLAPSVFNYIEPFKRPLSSAAQTIVVNEDGRLELVIGAAGGSRICTAILQAIIRTLVYGKDIVNVIANPRVHHQLLPEVAWFEPPIDNTLLENLKSMKHSVEEHESVTAMNGIHVENGKLVGQADYWRKLGKAVGL